MRQPWALVLVVTALAIGLLLWIGQRGGRNRHDGVLDSLKARGDSIAESAMAGSDSTLWRTDSIAGDREAREFTEGLIAQATAERERQAAELRRRTAPRRTLAVEVDTGATSPTDSALIADLRRLDTLNVAIIAGKDALIDSLRLDKLDLGDERDYWRDEAGILLKQVGDLNANNTATAEAGKSPRLNLGLFSIPRPVCGVGPGATIGIASNSHGTSAGGAAGLTASCTIPL